MEAKRISRWIKMPTKKSKKKGRLWQKFRLIITRRKNRLYIKTSEKGKAKQIKPRTKNEKESLKGAIKEMKQSGVRKIDIKSEVKVDANQKQKPYYGRSAGGKTDHLNSPSLAHEAVYGKKPKMFLSGRTAHPQKLWKGIPVDKNLKSKWLKELNSIPNTTIRGSCSGHDRDRVSYVVLRLDPKHDKDARDVARRLNRVEGVYSKADIGREGRPRIVVAAKKWPGKKGWNSWWDRLSGRIRKETKHLDASSNHKGKELELGREKKKGPIGRHRPSGKPRGKNI